MRGYDYIGSPYSHPEALIREERFIHAAYYLMQKLKRREWAYSPIVHCHQLSQIWGMPTDAEFWRDYDFAMLAHARKFEVLRLDGWDQSLGLKGEIEEATRLNIRIEYI
jgi:hypothetical protein